MLLRYSKILLRKLSASERKVLMKSLSSQTTEKNFQEVRIELPWGKICGKYWGPTDVQPIIAIHGIRDNAASFDPLATKLPENISLLAIDLPGHGFSSRIPRGFMYSSLLYLQTIHRIKEHYKIKKLKFIGHSLGGAISFMYTSLFPSNVRFLVALDIYKHFSWNSAVHLPKITGYWNSFFNDEKSMKPVPSFTEEEAVKKWIKTSKNSTDEYLAKILMTRGVTRKSDGTVFFNEDPRVKLFTLDFLYPHDYQKLLAKNIHCPFMVFKAENFDYLDPKEHYDDVLKVIKENSEDYRYHTAPGTHHLHMSHAENVSNIINPFILKYSD